MEEGEILNVSLVAMVQESCWAVLEQVLLQFHAVGMAQLAPGPQGGRAAGSDREFAVGLQCGLQEWCRLMLQPSLDVRW